MMRPLIPLRLTPLKGQETPAALYAGTRKYCKNIGIPVNDPEYDSAINWAVYKALTSHDPNILNGRSLFSLCIVYALRNCSRTRRNLATQRRLDEQSSQRGTDLPPTPLPLPLSDFELLCFVAKWGKLKASKLLGMNYLKLRSRLDEVALRVQEGVAAADPPPVYLLDLERAAVTQEE